MVESLPYRCFGDCGREFESLDEMVAVPGKGDRSPRHFCEECAERVRRGPPITDGGTSSGDTAREALEFLCWDFATSAERFWPVEETARSCMESVEESYTDQSEEELERAFAWERGQHARAIQEAEELFKQLHARGFDPVALAQSEIERSREAGRDIDDICWDWLQGTRLPDEYVESAREDDGGVTES